jgi:hypothetical protein
LCAGDLGAQSGCGLLEHIDAPRRQCDPRALTEQATRDPAADTSATARHQCVSAAERTRRIHISLPSLVETEIVSSIGAIENGPDRFGRDEWTAPFHVGLPRRAARRVASIIEVEVESAPEAFPALVRARTSNRVHRCEDAQRASGRC